MTSINGTRPTGQVISFYDHKRKDFNDLRSTPFYAQLTQDFDSAAAEKLHSTFCSEVRHDRDGPRGLLELVTFYDKSPKTRRAIDDVMIAICGWWLPTLIKMAHAAE